MYWLQARAFGLGRTINMLYGDYATPSPKFVPKIFTLTVRSSDWYYWVNDEVLRTRFTWLGRLLTSFEVIGVYEFRLELETVASKAEALRSIVGRIRMIDSRSSRPWTIRPSFTNFPSYTGKSASRMTMQEEQQETTWTGSGE